METTAINRKAFSRELNAAMRKSVRRGILSMFSPRVAKRERGHTKVSVGRAFARVGRCMYVAMQKYQGTNEC